MHEKLRRGATQKAWLWAILLCGIYAAINGVLLAFTYPMAGLVLFLVLWGGLVACSRACPPFTPSVTQLKVPVAPAAASVQSMVDGLCIALGRPPVRVLEADHPSLNVGLLDDLVITRGAREAMTRQELESVCAMQIAVGTDPAMVRLTNLMGWLTILKWGALLPLAAFVLLFLVVLVMLPLFGMTFGGAAIFFLIGRLQWWMRVASDAVTIQTTRYPEPLPSALRKIALYNGPEVPMGWLSKFNTADLAWTVSIGAKSRSTTTVNETTVAASSSELESDMRLLLSAQLITDVCVHAKPVTFDTWFDAASKMKDIQRRLGRGEAGVEYGDYIVTLDGVHLRDST